MYGYEQSQFIFQLWEMLLMSTGCGRLTCILLRIELLDIAVLRFSNDKYVYMYTFS
jgi:hypothetical protein